MRKLLAACTAFAMSFAFFTACDKQVYQNGTYTAQYADFDSRGYKDYIVLTVEDGQVTALEYNGRGEDGTLKTEDDVYQQQMEAVQSNYPEQVQKTLVNQYLVVQDIGAVDVVAGATYSTESFVALFKALEGNMYKGDETPVVVDNIPEK